MADFANLALTSAGAKALLEMQSGKTLIFSKIGLGSGRNTGSYWSMTDLVNPMAKLPITEKTVKTASNHVVFIAKMTNETLSAGFEWRELGLYYQDENGNDILFAASNAGEKYDYIPAVTDERYMKQIRLASTIADTENITIVEQEGLTMVDTQTFYDTIAELEERLKDSGGKLKIITENHTATADGQTVFNVDYATFDYTSDNLIVHSGRTILAPELDYTVTANGIVLTDGVPVGRTVTIRILKNVNTDAEDKTMSGAYIEDGSILLKKLAKKVVTCDVQMHMSVTASGGLRITYNDGN